MARKRGRIALPPNPSPKSGRGELMVPPPGPTCPNCDNLVTVPRGVERFRCRWCGADIGVLNRTRGR